ncbi:MAG TPA: GNAT family N-acetyltransferase [Candidatus Bathyarchaeia archaeon]|nr:GNAT family N-acetyltransferase [Candidatus Bathyarchaeia archaeon]
MIDIKLKENSSIDMDELLKLIISQKSNELGRELSADESTKITIQLEQILNSFVRKSFLAYEKGELVGWLGVNQVYPPTLLLYTYHPIINPDSNRKHVAQALIQKCIDYAIEKNIGNIRIFNDVTIKTENRFLELEQYYLNAGMKKTHIVLCMENKLSTNVIKNTVIDSEYHIEPWLDQSDEDLKECYERIFAKSNDNFTNSLDKEERNYWNTISRGNANQASIVIKKDNELVALILAVDYGDFMELGPIGVVPEHRGKKLGKVVMEECLSSLFKQGKVNCYLEVDATNTPAINLYKSYGFFEVSKKHGFLWRSMGKSWV